MRFTKEEIETVFRQHVIDQWNIPEDTVSAVEVRVFEEIDPPTGKLMHRVMVDVKVLTNDKDGGGPYRTPGR